MLLALLQIASRIESVDPQPFGCNATEWGLKNGNVKCSSFGGKDNVLELADAGGWTHAWQEIAVVPDAVYRVSGEFYAQKQGECES